MALLYHTPPDSVKPGATLVFGYTVVKTAQIYNHDTFQARLAVLALK